MLSNFPDMIEKEFTQKSVGTLLTKKGKEQTDYTDWGSEPLYKTVHGIKHIYKNRKCNGGGYVSLPTLRINNPGMFAGIESFTESIQG